MKSIFYIILLMLCFACKQNERKEIIPVNEKAIRDSVVKNISSKINFNKPPINIKEYTLNDNFFWITSGMTDSIYFEESFCDYKDYHLERSYYIIPKSNIDSLTNLYVYVKDDEFKWNREKANEEFLSIEVNHKSIRLWDKFFVGMSKNSLLTYIKNEEYHEDFGVFNVYTRKFQSDFYFENDTINKIVISRNCEKVLNLNEYLKQNKLDSLYKLSNKIIPNYLKADFDGDTTEDIVLLIEEIKTNKVGLAFIHKNNSYFILGAGKEYKFNNDDMNWLDILKLDYNKNQHETIIDEETYDIIGDKSITIPNIGVSIREIEGSGGLLYFSGSKYEYLHQGD